MQLDNSIKAVKLREDNLGGQAVMHLRLQQSKI